MTDMSKGAAIQALQEAVQLVRSVAINYRDSNPRVAQVLGVAATGIETAITQIFKAPD